MKNLIFFFYLLISFSLFGQNEINDGIARPVKGAYWKVGNEGKISRHVFEKISTSGYHKIIINNSLYEIEVDVERGDNSVLFQQYAPRNKNWVDVEKGEKIWWFYGKQQEYLATCGNKIKNRRPKTEYIPGEVIYVHDTVPSTPKPLIKLVNDEAPFDFREEATVDTQPFEPVYTKRVVKRKNNWVKPVIIAGASLLVGGVSYYLVKNRGFGSGSYRPGSTDIERDGKGNNPSSDPNRQNPGYGLKGLNIPISILGGK